LLGATVLPHRYSIWIALTACLLLAGSNAATANWLDLPFFKPLRSIFLRAPEPGATPKSKPIALKRHKPKLLAVVPTSLPAPETDPATIPEETPIISDTIRPIVAAPPQSPLIAAPVKSPSINDLPVQPLE
jgi:hypothetical protein